MINKHRIKVEPGNFYIDRSGTICYVERVDGCLVYSDSKHSKIPLYGYEEHFVAQINNPQIQSKFIEKIISLDKKTNPSLEETTKREPLIMPPGPWDDVLTQKEVYFDGPGGPASNLPPNEI